MELNEIFWSSFFNFGVMIILVLKFGKPALSAAMAARSENISNTINEASADYASVEGELGKWKKNGTDFELHARKLTQDAATAVAKVRENIISNAHRQAERMERDAGALGTAESQRAAQKLQSDMVSLSVELVSDYLRSLGPAQKKEQLQKTVGELSG